MPTKPSTTASAFRIGRWDVAVSNLPKVLYPEAGFTKGEVLRYYEAIAPVMLPHLKGRPVTLKRYPNGVDQPFFYEKACPVHRPTWVKTADVETTNRTIPFCVVDSAATLVWLANLAALELHTLLSKAPRLERPTMMVFDHDPGPGVSVIDCARVAVKFRDVLGKLGLESFVKTSGGKGIHLYVPLNTPVTFEQTKAFSYAVAQLLEKQDPGRVTTNMKKDLRGGRVFVDWSQNDTHKTTACAYTLRARGRPTVSTPVTWAEVERAVKKGDEGMLRFEAGAVLKRVEKVGDLFEGVLKVKQKLPGL
ncbi:MAG TPA: non-homologous end-joining DNA ligase [Tepidisphaeraceae bacterium]|nr:non-homologous end-joining DNA ligase [Tepidisphaeraceae bacterium]